MLILAEGLFRLDVVPHEDTIQTIVRSLSDEPRAELRSVDVGGETGVLGGPRRDARHSTGRFGGEVVLIGEDGAERAVAKVLVGSVCHLERGVTSFTAQATLAERLALRLGEAVEDLLQVGLGEAGVLGGANLHPRPEALLGHRHLEPVQLGDERGQLRLGLHKRPRNLDHPPRFEA